MVNDAVPLHRLVVKNANAFGKKEIKQNDNLSPDLCAAIKPCQT